MLDAKAALWLLTSSGFLLAHLQTALPPNASVVRTLAWSMAEGFSVLRLQSALLPAALLPTFAGMRQRADTALHQQHAASAHAHTLFCVSTQDSYWTEERCRLRPCTQSSHRQPERSTLLPDCCTLQHLSARNWLW